MSKTSWRASLRNALKSITGIDSPGRLAILGVGNELWGDDGAGPLAVRQLQKNLPARESRLLLDAGPAPENFSGPLRAFQPDFILLLDAIRPGVFSQGIVWIETSQLDGVSALTHGLPLSVLGEYCTRQLGVPLAVIGIQGEQFDFGAGLSPKTRRLVAALVQFLTPLLP